MANTIESALNNLMKDAVIESEVAGESKTTVNKRTAAWYIRKDPNGDYYTPYRQFKTLFEYVADGSRRPNPKEVVDYLKDNPTAVYTNGYFKRSLVSKTDSKEVTLPSGVYRFLPATASGLPERLVPFELRTDGYVELQDTYKETQKDIRDFVAAEDKYRKAEVIYKLGILMYGQPGMGKSAMLRNLLQNMDDVCKDSIVIFVEDRFPSNEFILRTRESLADRMKIFIFEELVHALQGSGWGLDTLLTFLDGEMSVDKCIILATTNYPEKLPMNVVNRPSRFDKLHEFGNPTDGERFILLKHFMKKDPSDAEVAATKEFSVASIKQIALSLMVSGKTFAEAIKEIKDRQAKCDHAFAKVNAKMGF